MHGQMVWPGSCSVEEASRQMAMAGVTERGAISTQKNVVEFILDLSGYTVDQPLCQYRLLEPSFGQGEFLHIAVERLLTCLPNHEGRPSGSLYEKLAPAIRAVELHPDSIEETRSRLLGLMIEKGINRGEAARLIDYNGPQKPDSVLSSEPHQNMRSGNGQ
ncbi:MAG: hypothetical protein HQL82_15620, partial [Magnetococcales bacterium]|nr:hypothetical protein [Magnetococcales bacterium]